MTATLSALMRGDFKSLFPALSRNATANGTGVDMVDYEGICLVQLDSAAGSAGTLDISLEESDDNSTFAAVPTAEITGGAFVQVTTGGASLQTRYIDIGARKRYIRGRCVIATGPFVFSLGLVGQKKYQS